MFGRVHGTDGPGATGTRRPWRRTPTLLTALVLTPLITVWVPATPAAGAVSDPAVWTWGSNDDGQMLGTRTRDRPVPLPVLEGVTAFSAHGALGAAVVGGTVWTWGGSEFVDNRFVTTATSSPRPLPGPTDVLDVAVSEEHVLAVDAAGDVWAWGANDYGQIGIGTQGAPVDSPTRLRSADPTLPDFVDVEAGYGYSVAVDEAGAAWSWGRADAGLAGGSTASRLSPAPVPGVTGVSAVSAAFGHVLALTASGEVLAWGSNSYAELGLGDRVQRPGPTQVPGLADVASLGTGERHSLAVLADGTLMAWGASFGRLLATAPDYVVSPTVVPGLPALSAVGAGREHNLAVATDGGVWTWGYGGSALGRDADYSNPIDPVPAVVTGLPPIVSVDGASSASFALDDAGTLHSFGQASSGRLGDGYGRTLEPVRAALPEGTTGIAAGEEHVLALTADGRVLGWGNNVDGQVAPGPNAVTSPLAVPLPVPANRVVAARDHSLAVDTGGTVWSWGRNGGGQLGDGTTTSRATPMPIGIPRPVVDLDAGAVSSIAVDDAGRVWTWGGNSSGELGTGDEDVRLVPTEVGLPADITVTDVAMGEEHAAALDSSGTLWTWGWNSRGQLGGGEEAARRRPDPQPVPGLPPVVAISAGDAQTFALEADGTVWEWGRVLPELGALRTPTAVVGIPPMQQVSGSGRVRMGLSVDGEVWVWGDNAEGDLATGGFSTATGPRRLEGFAGVESVHVSKDIGNNTLYVVADPSRATSALLDPGGTITTGPTATEQRPVTLAVTSPVGGEVSITDDPALIVPARFELLGSPFSVTAPPGTVEAPLVLSLTVHGSVVPEGTELASITPLRDGVPVADCASPADPSAAPDPCVSTRRRDPLGTVVLEVRTSRASTWAVVVLPLLPPLVTVSGLTAGDRFLLGAQVPVTVTCTDRGSAVTSCQAPALANTSTVGPKTLTASATDATGTVTTVEIGYAVDYGFPGFEGPAVAPPAVNVGQKGRTFPLAWSLVDAHGTRQTDLAAVQAVRVRSVACSQFDLSEGEVLPAGTPGSSGLSVDAHGRFTYNWQSPKKAGCYRLEVHLADGSAPWLAMSLR